MRIASYLISDMRPFTTTENKAFREMIKELEPCYQMPARATFRENIVPAMQEVVTSRLKQELKTAGDVALTCDAWTSRATESYVTITAHYVSKEFEQRSAVLQTKMMPDSHTGINTAEILSSVAEKWGLQVGSLTTDNAANMRVAA